MKKTVLLLFVVVAAFVSSGAAKKAPDPCSNPQTTLEMRECEAKMLKEADASLNKVYKQLISLIGDKAQKDRLKAAEQAWLKYRDAHCAFMAGFYEGGTMEAQTYTACLREMTEKRTSELQEALNQMN